MEQLLTFVNHEGAAVDADFMASFADIVAGVGNKINPMLFELILNIGINFAEERDDSYWFALIDCTDYGSKINSPNLIDILLDQVLLAHGNSWKAACLLCILIQDYESVKEIVINCAMEKHSHISAMFSTVKDYTACCYMFEMLSQLDSPSVANVLFPKHKLPSGAYCNDEECSKFLQQSPMDPSIVRFSSLKIAPSIQSSGSTCQLMKDWLIIIIDQNDSAAPIQLSYDDIKNVRMNGITVEFKLAHAVKKSLVAVDIPESAVVKIHFNREEEAGQLFEQLDSLIIPIKASRKISVVKNFIAATTTLYKDEAILPDGETVIGDVTKVTPKRTSIASSEIEETETMFGSINDETTKDTTHHSKRGRAVSSIIAQSNIKSAMQALTDPVLQVPDSAENVTNALDVPSKVKRVVKKTAQRPTMSKDIWDFDDDSNNTGKPRTMKVLGEPSKKNTNRKMTKLQKKLEQSDADEGKNTRELVMPDSKGGDVSFSGLSSPIVSHYKRVTRATYKANGPVSPMTQDKKDTDDDSYMPSLQTPVKKARVIKAEPKKSGAKRPATTKAQPKAKPKNMVQNGAKRTAKFTEQKNANIDPRVTGQEQKDAHPVAESTTVEKGERSLTDIFGVDRQPLAVANVVEKDPGLMTQGSMDILHANALLSEAYTTTLQRQIYESVTLFSTQLVNKIHIINDELNKKVMNDLTSKYETMFGDLKESFQQDVDEMCGFVHDVKGLLNLPEHELVEYIKRKKFGAQKV